MTKSRQRNGSADIHRPTRPCRKELVPGRIGEQRLVIAAQQVPCARPVDQTQRDLETAGPVRPVWIRTLRQPRSEQSTAALRKARLAADSRHVLSEGYQFEVPVGLPQVLNVTNQARDRDSSSSLAENGGRKSLGLWIAIPGGWEPQLPFAIAEHSESSGEDTFSRRKIRRARQLTWKLFYPCSTARGVGRRRLR